MSPCQHSRSHFFPINALTLTEDILWSLKFNLHCNLATCRMIVWVLFSEISALWLPYGYYIFQLCDSHSVLFYVFYLFSDILYFSKRICNYFYDGCFKILVREFWYLNYLSARASLFSFLIWVVTFLVLCMIFIVSCTFWVLLGDTWFNFFFLL